MQRYQSLCQLVVKLDHLAIIRIATERADEGEVEGAAEADEQAVQQLAKARTWV